MDIHKSPKFVEKKLKQEFETRAIHVGNHSNERTGSVSPAIHLTSTYEQDSLGQDRGFDYSRAINPTRQRLETNIATLEEGEYAISFSSGMAATTALFQTLKQGNHVIVSRNVYGGTYRVIDQVLSNHGLIFDFVDTRDLKEIESHIRPETKLLFLETPTNPLLEISDISAISHLCKIHKIIIAVDNTFMSPFGQRPLSLGADVVMHSGTKHIGGHSDIISGLLITSNKILADQLYFIQKAVGAIPAPFDCWLLLRSTKTLSLRVQQSALNAIEIAKWLSKQSMITEVIYPGLASHPQHELAKAQQVMPNGDSIFGSIISIRLKDEKSRDQFIEKLKIFTFAESLGGVESLSCVPYDMTHGAVPVDMKLKMGITPTLIRLSIGIENVNDLIQDLKFALT